jgi:hypothetical protein
MNTFLKFLPPFILLFFFRQNNIPEGLTMSGLDLCEFNRKRLRASNMIERLNQSVKQRTKVAKIFVNEDSCLKFWGDVLGIISSTLKLDFLALFGFCCLALH